MGHGPRDARQSGATALRVAVVVTLIALIAVVWVLRAQFGGTNDSNRGGLHVPAPHATEEPATEMVTREVIPAAPNDPNVAPRHAPIDGWRIEGRVHARGVPAIAGARVRIELVSSTVTRIVADTTTDADGRYAQATPALDALDPDRAPPVEVRVSVDARGYRPATTRTPIDLNVATRSAHADVRLEPGERINGRVVDGAGKPVAQATVAISVASSAGGANSAAGSPAGANSASGSAGDAVTTWSLVEETLTSGDGRFELGFASSARYRVQARCDGYGTGIVDDLALEASTSRSLGDVTLVGGKAIAGVVVDARGEPVANFEVGAVTETFVSRVDALTAARKVARDVERADGLATTHAFTDGQGRFALKGLRPGPYALVASEPNVPLSPAAGRYEPGRKDVCLELTLPRLLVRVVDDEGVPVRGAIVRLTELTTRDDGRRVPGRARFAPANLPGSVAAFTRAPEHATPGSASDASARSPVSGFSVLASVGARRSSEEAIGLDTRDVTLIVPRGNATGKIALDVQGADGAPLTGLVVAFESTLTRTRIEELSTLACDEHGEIAGVPCGTYHLVVGYAPGADRDHFPVRTQEPVVVTAEHTTVVSLHATRGGRATLHAEWRGAPPDGFDETWARAYDPARAEHEDPLLRELFGVQVMLTPESGGSPRPLQFRSGDGRGLLSRIVPRETRVGEELFEPGRYTVTLTSPLFELAEPASLRIEPGATGPTTITVRPR